MAWLEKIKSHFPQHKYAINAQQLGDTQALAWTNLGLWQAGMNYPQACQALAEDLAHRVNLNSKDQLLDLGCGKGASLHLWHKNYNIQNISAVELQQNHVVNIQEHATFLNSIYADSFLNLKQINFPNHFDVVLCIDAAYHTPVESLIDAMSTVLNSKARIGFHLLIWSEKAFNLPYLKKAQYYSLLKSADVKINHLLTETQLCTLLKLKKFDHIEVSNLSQPVLAGFSDYVEQQSEAFEGIDGFKIRMTAKLCQKLYREGLIEYVAVTASYKL